MTSMTDVKSSNGNERARFVAWTLAADSDITVLFRYTSNLLLENIRSIKQCKFALAKDVLAACLQEVEEVRKIADEEMTRCKMKHPDKALCCVIYIDGDRYLASNNRVCCGHLIAFVTDGPGTYSASSFEPVMMKQMLAVLETFPLNSNV